ncbi:MAG: heavy metal-binding domain-containing protein [Candidatus Solibacter sp.]
MTRRFWIIAGMGILLRAQEPDFVCPMDREVRAKVPGNCPRCGMKLVAGLPMPMEYPLDFRATPDSIPAGRDVVLEFRVLHPKTGKPVTHFETIHEKLFHLFLVSQDLEYFSHEHPVLGANGWFRLKTRLPKPGTYRLLADFDPTGGTPQLSARTFSTAGWEMPPSRSIRIPAIDMEPKQGANLSVSLRLDPAAPLAGKKTMLFFELTPGDGLERFLGAWAHLLAVSHDLVDTIHTHPFQADGGASMQFNLFLPRAATYRIWLQTQRRGAVNTVAFTVKVSEIA